MFARECELSAYIGTHGSPSPIIPNKQKFTLLILTKTQIVMKTKFLLCFCGIIATELNAQISTINVAEKQERESYTINKNIYDGSYNYPWKNQYELLIGEELYVLPLPPQSTIYNQSKEKGYKGFKTIKFNVKKDKQYSKRYGNPALEDKTNTKAEDLQNKIFIVRGFESSEWKSQFYRYCLLLEEKGNPNNVCKYAFDYLYDFNITFVTMKHYKYLKERCVGKQFYFDESCLPKNDSKTGEYLKQRSLHSWECKDIIISPESGKLTMLLSHEDEETFLYEYAGTIPHSSYKSILEGVSTGSEESAPDLGPLFMINGYSEEAWQRNVAKYGDKLMWYALNHKIVIGMPFELLKKSVGAPENYNSSSDGITQLIYKLDAGKIYLGHQKPLALTEYPNGKLEIIVYLDSNDIVTGWN